jgi:hypothetical protein
MVVVVVVVVVVGIVVGGGVGVVEWVFGASIAEVFGYGIWALGGSL